MVSSESSVDMIWITLMNYWSFFSTSFSLSLFSLFSLFHSHTLVYLTCYLTRGSKEVSVKVKHLLLEPLEKLLKLRVGGVDGTAGNMVLAQPEIWWGRLYDYSVTSSPVFLSGLWTLDLDSDWTSTGLSLDNFWFWEIIPVAESRPSDPFLAVTINTHSEEIVG